MHALDTMLLWSIAVKDEVCSPSTPKSTTGGRCAGALNPKLLSARTSNRYVTAKRGNPGQVHVKDLPKYFEFRPSKFFSIDTQVSNPNPWLQSVRMPQAPVGTLPTPNTQQPRLRCSNVLDLDLGLDSWMENLGEPSRIHTEAHKKIPNAKP